MSGPASRRPLSVLPAGPTRAARTKLDKKATFHSNESGPDANGRLARGAGGPLLANSPTTRPSGAPTAPPRSSWVPQARQKLAQSSLQACQRLSRGSLEARSRLGRRSSGAGRPDLCLLWHYMALLGGPLVALRRNGLCARGARERRAPNGDKSKHANEQPRGPHALCLLHTALCLLHTALCTLHTAGRPKRAGLPAACQSGFCGPGDLQLGGAPEAAGPRRTLDGRFRAMAHAPSGPLVARPARRLIDCRPQTGTGCMSWARVGPCVWACAQTASRQTVCGQPRAARLELRA